MGSDRVPRASSAPSGVNVVCSSNTSYKEGSGGGRVGGGSGREGQVLLLHICSGDSPLEVSLVICWAWG